MTSKKRYRVRSCGTLWDVHDTSSQEWLGGLELRTALKVAELLNEAVRLLEEEIAAAAAEEESHE